MAAQAHIIDCHAHFVPRDFGACPPGVPDRGWPELVPVGDGNARLVIDGRDYRILDRGYFDLEARLAFLDREGIAAQVVSPLPEMLGYWLAPETTAALAEVVNKGIAEAVCAAPDRIAGLGMLPLQDVERSLAMISQIADLGLRGVEVGTNVDGVSIADPRFVPVFAELACRDLCVMVHGLRPGAPERQLGPAIMANVVGIPQENATAVSSFIATDILARAPGLRLLFAHGGGTFGAVLDRMDAVWHGFPALGETSAVSPREYVRSFWFDSVTYSARYLRYLIDSVGPASVVCGTDGPGYGCQPDLAGLVCEACYDRTEHIDPIFWHNAVRFLGWEKDDISPLAPAARKPQGMAG